MSEMEGRVSRLEDQLALTLEELRQARAREMGLHAWAREMVAHMSQVDRGEFSRCNRMSGLTSRIIYVTTLARQHYPTTDHAPSSIPRQCRHTWYDANDASQLSTLWSHERFIRLATILQHAFHGRRH